MVQPEKVKVGTTNKAINGQGGFSLVELIVSAVITLVILGVAVTVFSSAISRRARESSRTDAITSAQAALNIMSREIGNAGYGLSDNGVVTDSTSTMMHVRSNFVNTNSTTTDAGEDVAFYLDGSNGTQSVVRHDNNTGETSGIINRISQVSFVYTNYDSITGTSSTGSAGSNTGRVTITLTVQLDNVQGQPLNQTVQVSSDVTLRNSTYMRGQY
jgi:Tfp pilus assembly protein PilW